MTKKTIMLWIDDQLKEDAIKLSNAMQLNLSDLIRRLLIQEITRAKERGLMEND